MQIIKNYIWFGSLLKFTKRIVARVGSTVGIGANICQIGAACGAVWVFFNPEQAADVWVKFEHHIVAARVSLDEINQNSATIAINTEMTAESTGVIAQHFSDISSVERGINAEGFVLDDGNQSVFSVALQNLSTTPLLNFKFALADAQGTKIGERELARLFGPDGSYTDLLWTQIPKDFFNNDTYHATVCARGRIGNTDTIAWFEIKMRGFSSYEGEGLIFHTVEHVMNDHPSDFCGNLL